MCAAPATRPLASVRELVEAGHPVGSSPPWDQRDSYIQHQDACEKMWLFVRDGVYVLRAKVAPNKWQTLQVLQGISDSDYERSFLRKQD